MVAILLALPASEATTAAVKAAKANPFKPGPNRFSMVGYALSCTISPFSIISDWNAPFWYNT